MFLNSTINIVSNYIIKLHMLVKQRHGGQRPLLPNTARTTVSSILPTPFPNDRSTLFSIRRWYTLRILAYTGINTCSRAIPVASVLNRQWNAYMLPTLLARHTCQFITGIKFILHHIQFNAANHEVSISDRKL